MEKIVALLAVLMLAMPGMSQESLVSRLKAIESKITPCFGCECGCGGTGVCSCGETNVKAKVSYSEAQQTAKEEGVPLVVYVGLPSRKIRSTVAVGVGEDRFPGYPDKCIIVSNRDGSWCATLPATATDADIQAALAPRAVSRSASPFTHSLFGLQAADGSGGCANGSCGTSISEDSKQPLAKGR